MSPEPGTGGAGVSGRRVTLDRPLVAVFGSSTLRRGEPGWGLAHELGELLAQRGFAIMNGGYQGAMEAVSEGARLAGGPVVGVTVELFNHRGPNPHLTHREDTATLLERLDVLMNSADAFVALEGSIGTLAELFLAWNLVAVDAVRGRAPILCVGPAWGPLLESLNRPGLVDPRYLPLVEHAHGPADAALRLERALRGVEPPLRPIPPGRSREK